MAEAIMDDQIRGSGVRNIFLFFDDHYPPYKKISNPEDFDSAVYRDTRSSTEMYVKQSRGNPSRYEKTLNGDRLPKKAKGNSHTLFTQETAGAKG